jgi:hypothetical protein
MKNSVFKISHVVIIIIALFCLYFCTHFWIGSKEQYFELKNKSLLLLFFNRFILNSIIISFLLIISFLISKILGKRLRLGLSLKKVLILEAIVLLISSVIMIVLKIIFEN